MNSTTKKPVKKAPAKNKRKLVGKLISPEARIKTLELTVLAMKKQAVKLEELISRLYERSHLSMD